MVINTALAKGPKDLKSEVLKADLCTGCGLCASYCPYIKAVGDKVAIVWDCGRENGSRCYTVCPRTNTDLAALDTSVFGAPRTDSVLGSHEALLMARAKVSDAQKAGQYGGVVSALIMHQLETKAISAAALTATEDGVIPAPFVAHTAQEVLASAGSKYGSCPSMIGLNKAVKVEPGQVAVVGRPCQITAVRKWQMMDNQPYNAKVGLVVGLFCFWSLNYKFYDYLDSKVPLSQVKKVDLPKEDFVAYTADGELHIPLDEVRPFIRPTCNQCFDVTSELADISVGSTEFDYDWNTLLVRSEKGKAAIDTAIAAGFLETKPFPAEREELLRRVVRNKKRRVLQALDNNGSYGYLQIADQVAREIVEG